MPTLSLKWSFIFPIHQSETGEDSHGNANHRLAKRTAPHLGKLSFSQRWPIHSDGLWIGLDPGNQHHDRHPGYFGRTEPGSRPDLCQSRSHSHECGSCGFSDKAPAGKSHPAALSRDNIDRQRLQRLLYGCPAVLANAWLFGPLLINWLLARHGHQQTFSVARPAASGNLGGADSSPLTPIPSRANPKPRALGAPIPKNARSLNGDFGMTSSSRAG